MKRRDFIKTGFKAGVALNALPLMIGNSSVRALGRSPLRGLLETQSVNNNKVLVIVQLAGGNDGLNTLVPINDPEYKNLRRTLGLVGPDRATDKLIPLDDHGSLAWHSAMSGMSQLYNNDSIGRRMAIIQNVGYAYPNLSHFRGTDIWNTATDSNIYASTGWIGRLLLEQNPNWPPTKFDKTWPLAIQFGSNLSNVFLAQNGGMGIAMSKLPDPQNASTHNYDDIPTPHTTQYDELAYVRLIQAETEAYTQTILGRSKQSNIQAYPKTQLGTDLSGVAQLIASQFDAQDVQTKIYLVTQPAYDTHSNQLTAQAKLLGELSDALLAFQQDIEAFGVADNVAVMTYSEFGRRPQENGSGTDHGTAAPHFIISTQVIPGVYGSDPKLDAQSLTAGNLTYDPLHEFRNVYATVLNEWLLEGSPDASSTIDSVLKTDQYGTYSSNLSWKSLGIFKAQPALDVTRNSEAPGLMLMQNYPNPASGVTTFEYALPATGPVELGIYDTRGVEIERVVDTRQEFGIHRTTFNVGRLPAGPYLFRLKTSAGEVSREMVVVR